MDILSDVCRHLPSACKSLMEVSEELTANFEKICDIFSIVDSVYLVLDLSRTNNAEDIKFFSFSYLQLIKYYVKVQGEGLQNA